MRKLVMRDGEEEEEEEESGSKAEFIRLTESNPFPVLNPPPATKRYTTFLLIKTPSYT